MNEWYTDFQGIGIMIIDKFVLVRNDKALTDFLEKKGMVH